MKLHESLMCSSYTNSTAIFHESKTWKQVNQFILKFRAIGLVLLYFVNNMADESSRTFLSTFRHIVLSTLS